MPYIDVEAHLNGSTVSTTVGNLQKLGQRKQL